MLFVSIHLSNKSSSNKTTSNTLIGISRGADVKRDTQTVQRFRPVQVAITTTIGGADRVSEPSEGWRVILQVRDNVISRTVASILGDVLLDPIQLVIVGLTTSRNGVLSDVAIDVPLTHITQTELRGIIAVRLHTTNTQHDESKNEEYLKAYANYSVKTFFCNRSDSCCEAREVY